MFYSHPFNFRGIVSPVATATMIDSPQVCPLVGSPLRPFRPTLQSSALRPASYRGHDPGAGLCRGGAAGLQRLTVFTRPTLRWHMSPDMS